jgi:hypothetical protein
VVVDSRDRVTVDLRGLGPAVKAQAAARNLTLAAFARAVIVESLKAAAGQPESSSWNRVDGQPVKLTLTLPLRQASWLVERARASGVSYGTYLASLIDGAPYPGGLAEAARALTASTDQLAAVSTDFQAFLGLIRQGRSAEAERYREAVLWHFGEIRKHMKLTSALAAEVRRSVRFRRTEESRLEEGEPE